MFEIPIAYVFFNRPGVTRDSFELIRKQRPATLFLVCDAPRESHSDDKDQVAESRRVVENIDWPCDVTKLYAEENMGCGHRISSAISHVLARFEQLIVLEDDCFADPSFFRYCETLLNRYKADQRVMAVSGNNFQRGQSRTNASYYFSKYPHCWGWATWRRAWNHFQLGIPEWPRFRDEGHLAAVCESRRELNYWTRIFDHVHEGRSSSWAYPWTLCCWMNHGLTALPNVNLVSNHGFGKQATHTMTENNASNLPRVSLGRIVHPRQVFRHVAADQYTDNHIFSGDNRRASPIRRVRHLFQSRQSAVKFPPDHRQAA